MNDENSDVFTEEDARTANGIAIKKVLRPYVLLGVILAFVPEQMAASIPYLKDIADVMSHLLPAINGIPQVSAYPSSMRLYLVVMWLCMPWFAVRMAFSWAILPGRNWENRASLIRLFLLSTGITLMFIYYIGLDVISEKDIEQMVLNRGKGMFLLFTQFRIGTALMGTLLFWISSIVISWQVLILHTLMSGYVSKEVN